MLEKLELDAEYVERGGGGGRCEELCNWQHRGQKSCSRVKEKAHDTKAKCTHHLHPQHD